MILGEFSHCHSLGRGMAAGDAVKCSRRQRSVPLLLACHEAGSPLGPKCQDGELGGSQAEGEGKRGEKGDARTFNKDGSHFASACWQTGSSSLSRDDPTESPITETQAAALSFSAWMSISFAYL